MTPHRPDHRPEIEPPEARGLSESARQVLDFLRQRGASFFADIVRGTGRLKAEVETALWELVAGGLAAEVLRKHTVERIKSLCQTVSDLKAKTEIARLSRRRARTLRRAATIRRPLVRTRRLRGRRLHRLLTLRRRAPIPRLPTRLRAAALHLRIRHLRARLAIAVVVAAAEAHAAAVAVEDRRIAAAVVHAAATPTDADFSV